MHFQVSLLGLSELRNYINNLNDEVPEWISPITVDTYSGFVDEQAQHILDSFYPLQVEGMPFKVTADGNCLFHALSKAINDDESLSVELRVRTAIEMIKHSEFYKSHPLRRIIAVLSPDFKEACVAAACQGGYSSMWTILALSNVIGHPIKCIYPSVNGQKDFAFKQLNTTVQGNCLKSEVPYTIMWTRVGPKFGNMWLPNHFAPILRNKKVQHQPFDKFVLGNVQREFNNDSELELSDTSVNNETGSNKCSISCHGAHIQHVEDTALSSDRHKLINGQKLSTEEIFKLVICNTTFLKETPNGKKDNVYFVVDNSKNMQKREHDKKCQFYDDCGTWDTSRGNCNETNFVYNKIDGSLKYVYKTKDLFCTSKREKGKQQWIPLQIQPVEDDVITMRKYYATLKRDSKYSKLVSWFPKLPDQFRDKNNIAVIQYLGIFPEIGSKHGNSTLINDEFVRTKPETIDLIAQESGSINNKKLYAKLSKFPDAPRDIKQIRNKKYYENNKNNNSNMTSKCNLADDLLNMVSQIHEHDLLQAAILLKHKAPAYVLYTADQMTDLVYFLKSGDGVVGIDRTFNLSSCYLTTIVYKNKKVIRKETKENPVFIGPMFMHFEASFEMYHAFLSHISAATKSSLTKVEISMNGPLINGDELGDIIIGSDDEQALVKAIDSLFPTAQRIFCTKHMKDNVTRYLTDKEGATISDRRMIISEIFDTESGLISCKTLQDFQSKSHQFALKYKSKFPIFVPYFEAKLKARVMKNLSTEKYQQSTTWTNNNCESMNNVLKVATNWKVLNPSTLMDTINNEVVNVQMTDLRRSLHSEGNFRLAVGYEKYVISHLIWNSMSEAGKDEAFSRFLRNKTVNLLGDQIQAKCSDFNIPLVQRVAKKPGQKTRPKQTRCKPRPL